METERGEEAACKPSDRNAFCNPSCFCRSSLPILFIDSSTTHNRCTLSFLFLFQSAHHALHTACVHVPARCMDARKALKKRRSPPPPPCQNSQWCLSMVKGVSTLFPWMSVYERETLSATLVRLLSRLNNKKKKIEIARVNYCSRQCTCCFLSVGRQISQKERE